MPGDLTISQNDLISEFVLATDCEGPIALSYLESSNWNIKVALDRWFENTSRAARNFKVGKLTRGISSAPGNAQLVLTVRNAIDVDDENNFYNEHDSNELFCLPEFNGYGEEFKQIIMKDLVEYSVMDSLETAGRLNWWCAELGYSNKLWPLATTGDGNCLLHAASLSMWGIQDRSLTLRDALYKFLLSNECKESLKRRWRFRQIEQNAQLDVRYSEDEWKHEWEMIVNMASTKKRPGNKPGMYESLEEIHIMALAHVIRRAIIVVADIMLKDSQDQPFAPIPFGGIYLPIEIEPSDCKKNPLLLVYDTAHFSPLVAMEQEKNNLLSTVIPLVDAEGTLLPLHFFVDPGENVDWQSFDPAWLGNNQVQEKDQVVILKKYLNLEVLGLDGTELDNEEYEKHYIERMDPGDGELELFNLNNKNKAAKSFQSLGKQVGSIGKSMSKNIKKHLESLAKLGKPKKTELSHLRILCAEVISKRSIFQDRLIENYLKYKEETFLLNQIDRVTTSSPELIELKEQAIEEGVKRCINTDCECYGTVLTSYMCPKCYELQKIKESKFVNDAYFGAGKSKFYRESDLNSYDALKKIPVVKLVTCSDRTLYLSNTTFYNDSNKSFENNCTVTNDEHKTEGKTVPVKIDTDKKNSNTSHVSPFKSEENYSGNEIYKKVICQDDYSDLDLQMYSQNSPQSDDNILTEKERHFLFDEDSRTSED